MQHVCRSTRFALFCSAAPLQAQKLQNSFCNMSVVFPVFSQSNFIKSGRNRTSDREQKFGLVSFPASSLHTTAQEARCARTPPVQACRFRSIFEEWAWAMSTVHGGMNHGSPSTLERNYPESRLAIAFVLPDLFQNFSNVLRKLLERSFMKPS